jgi:hypothetical protein
MNELTADLEAIGAELSRAIRRDHERRARGSVARVGLLVAVAAIPLSGTALAAGTFTGVIDLGGAQSATPVSGSLGAGDPNLAYRYRIDGLPADRDGTGPVYIESTQPLKTNSDGHVDASVLASARHACAPTVKSVADATIWVFDTGCSPVVP